MPSFLAQAGQSCHRGAMIAPPVLGKYGYSVDLVHIDTESSVDVARTQTERAINEGAQCIVGAFDSGGRLAMAQVCEQRQIPLVVNVAAAPQLTEQGYKYLVRNFPTGGQIVVNGLKLIKSVLDATKLIPEEQVPVKIVGRMVLDRRVDNFFAETEQVAFCTQNIVPGIDFSDDPLLQGRNFSYLDTQLKRLGGPNFTHLPVNAPRCPFALESCAQLEPPLKPVGPDHLAACLRIAEIAHLRDMAKDPETWARSSTSVA